MANVNDKPGEHGTEPTEYLAEIHRVNQANRAEAQKQADAARPDNFTDEDLRKLNIRIGDPARTPEVSDRTSATATYVTQESYDNFKRRIDLDTLAAKFFAPDAKRELNKLANENPALYRVLNLWNKRGKRT